jgi:hypothetical protein
MRLFRLTIVAVILITSVSLLAQWSEPRRISGGGLYPSLLVRGDTVHVVYTKMGGRGKICYLNSIDKGVTWSNGAILNDTVNFTAANFPKILANGQKLIVTWLEAQREGFQLLYIGYAISNNDGLTWSEPRRAFNPGYEGIYLYSAASSDSTIIVIYSRLFLSRMRFNLVRSTDFGTTWSSPEEIFNCEETGFPDMAAYGETFLFVWPGNFEQGVLWETYYVKSCDSGNTWTGPELLTPYDGYGSVYPTLAINELGEMVLCWTDGRYSPIGWTGDNFVRFSRDMGDTWLGEIQITFLHLDMHPDMFYLGDTIHVAFERHDAPIRDIYYMKSIDNGVTWEDEVNLDLDPADSHDPEVGYGNGYTYVFWCDDGANPDTTIMGGLYFSKYPYDDTVEITEVGNLPCSIGLTAYPNPFNSTVLLFYSFQDTEGGELTIYNIQGQSIISYNLEGKEGEINWDARDAMGNKVCSGTYFARAKSSVGMMTAKLVYLK